MKNDTIKLLCLFALPVLGCQSAGSRNVETHRADTPAAQLHRTDTLIEIKRTDTSGEEKEDKLIAFVGEKIEVKQLPHKKGSMDAGFSATYKVLQRVYGSISLDTIEFTAYDHYGWPEFSRFKNVLLFVVESEGRYYHEKYMYSEVYKTNNGKWAGPYQQEDYKHVYNKKTL